MAIPTVDYLVRRCGWTRSGNLMSMPTFHPLIRPIDMEGEDPPNTYGTVDSAVYMHYYLIREVVAFSAGVVGWDDWTAVVFYGDNMQVLVLRGHAHHMSFGKRGYAFRIQQLSDIQHCLTEAAIEEMGYDRLRLALKT